MTDYPITPSFDLTGRRALVTGASSGIGLGAALALAGAGAQVTIAARNEARLHEIAGHMAAENRDVQVLPLDIADIAATGAAIAENGPFDILLNSAGIAIHSPAVETSLADFDKVMAVNLRGAYFLTRAVAKGLIAAGRPGSMINISSQMGHVGGAARALYCASKHAVEGFSKAMAIEWGPRGIRVNTICPTFILTPLTQATFDDPDSRAWLESKIKLARTGKVQDIMGAVVYLASEASALVTGSAMMIDGGWTAG